MSLRDGEKELIRRVQIEQGNYSNELDVDNFLDTIFDFFKEERGKTKDFAHCIGYPDTDPKHRAIETIINAVRRALFDPEKEMKKSRRALGQCLFNAAVQKHNNRKLKKPNSSNGRGTSIAEKSVPGAGVAFQPQYNPLPYVEPTTRQYMQPSTIEYPGVGDHRNINAVTNSQDLYQMSSRAHSMETDMNTRASTLHADHRLVTPQAKTPDQYNWNVLWPKLQREGWTKLQREGWDPTHDETCSHLIYERPLCSEDDLQKHIFYSQTDVIDFVKRRDDELVRRGNMSVLARPPIHHRLFASTPVKAQSRPTGTKSSGRNGDHLVNQARRCFNNGLVQRDDSWDTIKASLATVGWSEFSNVNGHFFLQPNGYSPTSGGQQGIDFFTQAELETLAIETIGWEGGNDKEEKAGRGKRAAERMEASRYRDEKFTSSSAKKSKIKPEISAAGKKKRGKQAAGKQSAKVTSKDQLPLDLDELQELMMVKEEEMAKLKKSNAILKNHKEKAQSTLKDKSHELDIVKSELSNFENTLEFIETLLPKDETVAAVRSIVESQLNKIRKTKGS